jgi:hypothetical protein
MSDIYSPPTLTNQSEFDCKWPHWSCPYVCCSEQEELPWLQTVTI